MEEPLLTPDEISTPQAQPLPMLPLERQAEN